LRNYPIFALQVFLGKKGDAAAQARNQSAKLDLEAGGRRFSASATTRTLPIRTLQQSHQRSAIKRSIDPIDYFFLSLRIIFSLGPRCQNVTNVRKGLIPGAAFSISSIFWASLLFAVYLPSCCSQLRSFFLRKSANPVARPLDFKSTMNRPL
jgi:hypothetical protein